MTRLLVCSDRIGAADPPAAARAIATAFHEAAGERVQLAVVPLAADGPDLRASLAALGAEGEWVADRDARRLGRLVAAALEGRPERLYADLTALAPQGTRAAFELLAGLGVDETLPQAARLPGGAAIVGVLPADQDADRLLGAEGVAARHGFAAGLPADEAARQGSELARLAAALSIADAPGLGGAGGAALAIAAVGGRSATGVRLCAEAADLAATMRRADLVVVGADTVTTGNFGGPVLIAVASLATDLGLPVVAVARSASISTRELRRHGVEAVRVLEGGGAAPAASDITAGCAAIARTWTR